MEVYDNRLATQIQVSMGETNYSTTFIKLCIGTLYTQVILGTGKEATALATSQLSKDTPTKTCASGGEGTCMH